MIEGTVVRKAAPEEKPSVRLQKTVRPHARLSRSRAIRKQRARLTVLGVFGAALVVGLSVILLSSMEQNKRLSGEIAEREKTVEQLTVYNDTREYEISSSVDLSDIIAAATQELGMVRSNASQIITYSVKNSEYLQQVAQVPAN